ncbi:hypothetical protein N9064_00480 [bacterium]|nr:hypothetical protein [bacterium]
MKHKNKPLTQLQQQKLTKQNLLQVIRDHIRTPWSEENKKNKLEVIRKTRELREVRRFKKSRK